jgi:hypothetical protein
MQSYLHRDESGFLGAIDAEYGHGTWPRAMAMMLFTGADAWHHQQSPHAVCGGLGAIDTQHSHGQW